MQVTHNFETNKFVLVDVISKKWKSVRRKVRRWDTYGQVNS